MLDPPASLNVGPLEIWDAAKKSGQKMGATALDNYLSWFPDGKRLAYVELVLREKVAKPISELGDFGTEFKKWERLPAVYVLDTDTKKKSFLHIGWQPIVSSDGKTVLVSDFKNRWRLVNEEARTSKAVQWPGNKGAIALINSKLVVYWGLPTKGTRVRYT